MPNLSSLPAHVRGVLALTGLVVNTLFWCALLLTVSVVKLAFPFARVRTWIDPALNALATAWIACNGVILWDSARTQWDVQGAQDLRADDWYMVTSNHQSWVDIFVLQRLLSRRVPMLKFFLKQELAFVPVIGAAWWALDFPFMRRHGKAALRKHPELRLQDHESARRACAKFALVPTSVMTFPEGTRFTDAKRDAQASPFLHLLRPKAGSLAMALNAMGDQFRSLLDVTIVYPDGVPSFWQFLCGRCRRVAVRVRQVQISPELRIGNYVADTAFRRRFHQWLHAIWQAKDTEIDLLVRSTTPAFEATPLRPNESSRGR